MSNILWINVENDSIPVSEGENIGVIEIDIDPWRVDVGKPNYAFKTIMLNLKEEFKKNHI